MTPRERERREPPAIVLRDGGANAELLREVCAGVEEEGVPVRVDSAQGTAGDLARAAAADSVLQVGIGVDRAGAVVVRHRLLAAHAPVLTVAEGDRPDWRRAGRVAARIITTQPLE